VPTKKQSRRRWAIYCAPPSETNRVAGGDSTIESFFQNPFPLPPRFQSMGLSAGFKQYVAKEFPDAFVKASDPAVADVTIVDAMVVLHSFKPDSNSPHPGGHQLADRFYFLLWKSSVGVLCFDDVHGTPRAKEQEWSERAKTTGACSPDMLEQLLARHELPPAWDDFICDRTGRQRINTYLRDELFKRMRLSRGLVDMQRLLVFNAGDGAPAEGVWKREEQHAPFLNEELIVRERADWTAALVGEGEMCCIRAAMLLRDSLRPGARVVVSTVDTDAVLIAMLNSFPGLFVELSHFDKKAGAPSYALVDAHALAAAVERRLRVTKHDFSVIALSKGSDFVTQSVAGIADWAKYVDACCSHIKLTTPVVTVSASEARVDLVRADAMLRSLGTLGKRVVPKYDSANHLKRLAWNTLYFSYAAKGTASASLQQLESYGWCVKGGMMGPDERVVGIRSAPAIAIAI